MYIENLLGGLYIEQENVFIIFIYDSAYIRFGRLWRRGF